MDAALKQQATVGNQYHLAHPDRPARRLQRRPDRHRPEEAEGVKALLDKGELDFNAAAVRYSDSPNALEGGDLGWRSLMKSRRPLPS